MRYSIFKRIVDPEQAEMVMRINREYLEGLSIDIIAASLEADGINMSPIYQTYAFNTRSTAERYPLPNRFRWFIRW